MKSVPDASIKSESGLQFDWPTFRGFMIAALLPAELILRADVTRTCRREKGGGDVENLHRDGSNC